MDKAKAQISEFLGHHNHHSTTVEERVAPAVTRETVKPAEHENVTTAVDREVHQDHYHTTVQPVQHKEVLPETHEHQARPVEHTEHHHGNADALKQKLEMEAARFKDESTTAQAQHTHSTLPTVGGEHRHHHVHEVIQPIIQKETVQPHVVHTTVPVHEVHHNEARHHQASTLPAMTMADFQRQGGSLEGRDSRFDEFEGEPKGMVGKAEAALGIGKEGRREKELKREQGTDGGIGGAMGRDNVGTGGLGGHHGTGSGLGGGLGESRRERELEREQGLGGAGTGSGGLAGNTAGTGSGLGGRDDRRGVAM